FSGAGSTSKASLISKRHSALTYPLHLSTGRPMATWRRGALHQTGSFAFTIALLAEQTMRSSPFKELTPTIPICSRLGTLREAKSASASDWLLERMSVIRLTAQLQDRLSAMALTAW